ncbi:xanthomonadin biosynthesis protein [Xanthomonas campestris pv. raphani]
MMQPCSPALPPGPSVPQLACGMELAQRRPGAGCCRKQCNERSAEVTYEGEALNLPRPATVMTTARSRPHASQSMHRSRIHQRVCSTTA